MPKGGGVPEQQVQAHRHQQGIPGAVEQDEPLAEGNGIVEGELGGPVGGLREVFNQYEGEKVKGQPQSVFQLPPGDADQAQKNHLILVKIVQIR